MLDYSKSRRLWFRIGLLVLIAVVDGLVVRTVKVPESGTAAFRESRSDGVEQPAGALRPAATGSSRELRAQRFGEAHRRGLSSVCDLLGSVQAGYSYGIEPVMTSGGATFRPAQGATAPVQLFNTEQPKCPTGDTRIISANAVGPTTKTKDAAVLDTVQNQLAKTVTPTVTSSSRWTWKAPSPDPSGSRPTTPSNE